MEPAHDWKEMRSGFVKFSTADGAAVMLLQERNSSALPH